MDNDWSEFSADELAGIDLLLGILRAVGRDKNVKDLALIIIQFADCFEAFPSFIVQLEKLAGLREDSSDINIADDQSYKAA